MIDAVTESASELQEYTQQSERAMSGQKPEQNLDSLGSIFLDEFARAEVDRRPTEERWLQDLRQYKGKYDPNELAAIGATRSKSYVRKTRVKVKTVDSRVGDLAFPAGTDKGWDIAPTPKPTIAPEMRVAIANQMVKESQAQQQQAMQQAMQQAQQTGQAPPQPDQVKQPSEAEIDAAINAMSKQACQGMSKVIEDQLIEARYKRSALSVLHSGHLYGTGILKGPLVERRVRTRFVQEQMLNGQTKWTPKEESYLVPFVECVPVWRWYPDMAATTLDQCRFVFERHQFSYAQLYALTSNKSFHKKKIIDHLDANPDGVITHRYYDSELKAIGERQSKQGDTGGQYEVLERWGWIDGKTLRGIGVDISDDRINEAFFSNVWVLPNGVVIKAVLQPIDGVTWPYHLYFFDKDETSIFGEGLPSVMRDDQKMLNAATRMMLDNGAITSGPMVEFDVSLLANVEDLEVVPWKKILRNGKLPGTSAVRAIEMPNNLEWLQPMARMFDQNADEVTAIPRYMTGENATSGAAGTSSGLSMLMGAVNIVIKDLLTGYDEDVTNPFLQSLYKWNMKFHPDPAIKGDFDVYARGTASLVAKEVRARQLDEFSTLTNNPADAPFIKRHKLNQLRAEALEMSDVVKTEDEVNAENASEQAQAQVKLQQDMQTAQLAIAQANAAKLTAEAEVAKGKLQEMMANIKHTMAEIERTQAETINKKVEAIFAALQAGGVATSRPTIAPAGDEILKSAGFLDATPDPSIAMLDGQPVQQDDGTHALMNRGQAFAQEPRGDAAALEEANGQPVPGGADAGDNRPDQANPDVAMHPNPGIPQPATGMVGKHRGIETAGIEGAPA